MYIFIYIKRSFNSYMQKLQQKVIHILFLSSCVTLPQKLQQGHSSKLSEDKMGCVFKRGYTAQNHRIAEARRDCWRSPSPTSPL